MNIITGFHHHFMVAIHWSQTAASATADVADVAVTDAVTDAALAVTAAVR